MKKVTRILGLCALVALATVSCKKNENTNEGGKSFFATINQPTNGAKTHIGDEDYLFWDEGEQIKVYTENGEAYGIFTNKSGAVKKAEFTGEIVESDKYVAFYPVTNIGDQIILKVNDEQTYVADNFGKGEYPMAAFNQGDDFLFRSPCAVVCLPLKGNAKINTITLSDLGGNVLAGDFNVNLNGFNPASWSTYGYNGAKESVVLDCKGQELTSTPTNFYFVVAAPETVFESGIQFVIEYEGGSKTLTSTNGNSLNAETILTMDVAEINKPAPEIGDFTVSYGKRITFAPGNLWYDASNTGKEWRMEDDQLDFHGGADSDAMGLFSWSNQNNNYGLGHTTGNTFKDWGELSICKPGSTTEQYAPGEWRTLTAFEQLYLLEYRNRASELRNVKNIDGINYVVLMPDNWTGSWNSNWETLREQGGFAMAMVGGYVPFNPENPQDFYGPYAENEELAWWSSDLNTNDPNQGQSKLLYYFLNNSYNVYGDEANGSQYHMFSVRLVKDVE